MNKALSSIPAANKSCTVAPIPAFRRQRKHKFKVISGYIVCSRPTQAACGSLGKQWLAILEVEKTKKLGRNHYVTKSFCLCLNIDKYKVYT